ncbi:uncharacterized protein [Physcomitrium patens]|uniref:Uncharacterized protein n=1 Tax=Physcomitrium patens TaxID=3218 RepID=A0A2K1J8Q8_PHYPA|nr:uncharacterized protein LOC112293380 [Physcomitrium patens]PNR37912.1 hypothetical protein PHYPA_021022 [Physcomitrium patens]|eukprot:XP_024398464.1 uncharacterized protein LOC112293380 [Physcomitrella patens]
MRQVIRASWCQGSSSKSSFFVLCSERRSLVVLLRSMRRCCSCYRLPFVFFFGRRRHCRWLECGSSASRGGLQWRAMLFCLDIVFSFLLLLTSCCRADHRFSLLFRCSKSLVIFFCFLLLLEADSTTASYHCTVQRLVRQRGSRGIGRSCFAIWKSSTSKQYQGTDTSSVSKKFQGRNN